jgi:hypothetical protein
MGVTDGGRFGIGILEKFPGGWPTTWDGGAIGFFDELSPTTCRGFVPGDPENESEGW